MENNANDCGRKTLVAVVYEEVCGGLPGGAVVKGAVLQRQLCTQRPWVCTQALS
jgi:hypothetical protein